MLAKIRVSAHDLAIEIGRYSGQLRQSRICLACDSGSVEDEEHFLLSCVAYETLCNKVANGPVNMHICI